LTKHILLFFIFTITLFAGVIKTPILSINSANETVTIKINKIDVGVSGFIVHRLSKRNSSILKDVVVIAYDENTKIATLQMKEFDQLKQNSLPSGNWDVEVGDIAILAFGYTRALLIAPNEEIYYRITKVTNQIQWVHPDLFATTLSFNGHPTPLKEDFNNMANTTSIGLVFFFINQKLFTVDAKSMKILNITNAELKQDSLTLPFYTRVENIDSNWFGDGNDELEEYEPYYCELLMQNNQNNKELQKTCSMSPNQIQQRDSTWSITNIYNNLF